MSKMKDSTIDLIITSPPYNKAGYEGFLRKRHKKDSWANRNVEYGGFEENDFMDENEYKKEQIRVLNEMCRIIKPNGSIFYNHKIRISKHKASHPIEWILKSNLIFRQQIVWNRKNSPAFSPIRYLPNTELIFWLTKTQQQPNFSRSSEALFMGEVWEFPARPNKLHPAPFPEELPFNIMTCLKNKSSNIIVYDPYCGTGTTCKVAKDFGFNFIGSELISKYCNIAIDKIKNQEFQPKLF